MVVMISGVNGEETYDYTLLIYMNGSDLESEYHAGSDDLLEMIRADVPDNVAVIIQTGGTRDWHSNQYGLPTISASKIQRWRLTDDDLELVENVGNYNMGAAETLSDFITFGKSTYPSDQYSLFMWNHGAGAVYGYGVDEVHDYDTMTLDEMQTAFELSAIQDGSQFDLIGFDACLMASVEVGHVLAPYASYLIGSEELEPGHGWNYTPILNAIDKDADIGPVALGKVITTGFAEQAKQMGTDQAITLSIIDLDQIDEVVLAIDGLLQRVQEGLATEGLKEQLLKYRLDAESYGEGGSGSGEAIPDSDMVDIVDYTASLQALYPIEVAEVIAAVDEAVVNNLNSQYKPNASGLSMYFPARDQETMVIAAGVLDLIDMSKVYVEFIQTVSNIITGTNVTLEIDTETSVVLENDGIDGDNQYYYFQMEESDLAAVEAIYTVMGRIDKTDNDNIQYLARDLIDDEAIGTDGKIIGETLDYWVQINGIDVAMYYEDHDASGVVSYTIPIMLNDTDANLIVLFDEANPKGHILGAKVIDENHVNIQNRSLIQLKATDNIKFLYEYDLYDLFNNYYYYDGWYYIDEITVGDGLELMWQPLGVGEYAYCFEILDIYGEITTTDWLSYEYYEAAVESNVVDSVIWDNVEEETAVDETIGQNENGDNVYEDYDYPWLLNGVAPPSEWALPYINTAYNNNLLTNNTFDQFGESITREVFCELVVNMYETSIDKSIAISSLDVFSDTQNREIVKAYQLGIVSGYGDGRFGPDDLITREQLMTMFYRALVKLDGSLLDYYYPQLSFDDAGQLSTWADEPSRLLVYYELIDGIGNNQLAPQNNATIEQSIKLVNGVYEFYIVNTLPSDI